MTSVVAGSFEWNSEKNQTNSEKHGIAFEEAIEVFDAPYLRVQSDRSDEVRWLAVGEAQGSVIAVIYTERRGRIRIISARRARTSERESYHGFIGDTS